MPDFSRLRREDLDELSKKTFAGDLFKRKKSRDVKLSPEDFASLSEDEKDSLLKKYGRNPDIKWGY